MPSPSRRAARRSTSILATVLGPFLFGCSLSPLPPAVRVQLGLAPERVGPVSFLALPSRLTGPSDVKGFDCLYATLTSSADTSEKACAADAAAASEMRLPGAMQSDGVAFTTTAGDKTIKMYGVIFSPIAGNCPVATLEALWNQSVNFGIFPVASQSPVTLASGTQTVNLANTYPASSTNDVSLPCRPPSQPQMAYFFYGYSGQQGYGSPVSYFDNAVSAFPPYHLPNGPAQMGGGAMLSIPSPPGNLYSLPPSGGGSPQEFHSRLDVLYAASGFPSTSSVRIDIMGRGGGIGSSNGQACDGSQSLSGMGYEFAVFGTDSLWHHGPPPTSNGTATLTLPASVAIVHEPNAPGPQRDFVHITLRSGVASLDTPSYSCSAIEVDSLAVTVFGR